MCGLVARLGERERLDRGGLRQATRQLAHRGPDEEQVELGPGWALGFRRLRILDLSSTGSQPMATSDGRYRLAFNGELYNYLKLRRSSR